MGSQKCQWSGRPKTDNRLKNMSALTKYNTCLDICLLVGVLSQVNHDELHQGCEHKLHSISKSFISQAIIQQVMFFEPIYIPRALNTGTCIRQGDRFYSAGQHRNHVLATANTGEIGRGFGKKCRWMDRKVDISKEEILGSKHSMQGYVLTYSRL